MFRCPSGTDPQHLYNPEDLDFRLKAGSAAIDAGMELPTITDGFTGKAPDLGAYELGRPLPHYGPRSPPPGAPAADCAPITARASDSTLAPLRTLTPRQWSLSSAGVWNR